MTLDVRVQRARCIATKSCVSAAPRTFALDATDVATVTDASGDPDDDVITAAEACPTGAISVYRDGVQIA
ncbi:MAG TPA: ferredoxin [Acidimicrobiales bacterium]|jgi:ferredoxin|nr:ferredoxin [Acidimicrobiales bacterium]